MEGITELDGVCTCADCGKCIGSADGNFCSHCGNPLTDMAILLKFEREKSVKLTTLGHLITKITDPVVLKIILDEIKAMADR